MVPRTDTRLSLASLSLVPCLISGLVLALASEVTAEPDGEEAGPATAEAELASPNESTLQGNEFEKGAGKEEEAEEEEQPWRRPPGLTASRRLSERDAHSTNDDDDALARRAEGDSSAFGNQYVYRKRQDYRWFSPASVALGVRMFPVSVEFWNDDGPERYSFTTTTIGLDLGLALSPADSLRFTFLAGAEFTVSAFDVAETMEPRPFTTIVPGGRLLLGFDIEVRALSLGIRYGLREFWADEEDEGQMQLVSQTRQIKIMQLLGAIVVSDRLRIGLGLEFPVHSEVIDYTVLFEFSLRFHVS